MAKDVHVHVHLHLAHETEILDILHRLDSQGASIVADLSAITASVASLTDVVASADALLAQLSQEIRASAGDQTAINALADQIDAERASLSDAVAANTPAAPAPAPAPEPAPAPADGG